MPALPPRSNYLHAFLAFVLITASLLVVALTPKVEAAAAAQQTPSKEIVFGKLKPYDHKSGWFTISIPENWTPKDGSFGDQAILTALDETTNGAFAIRAYPSKELTQSEIAVALRQYMHDTMAALPGFTMGDTANNPDGSVGLVFHYDQKIETETFKMYGEVLMKQNNGILGWILFLLPQDQSAAKVKSAYEVRATFRIIGKPKA
jgi:hypothetical protein